MSIITDHALLRWIQRVHEIDVERMRGELEALCSSAVTARAHHVPVGPVWAVIKYGHVVTFIPNKPKNMALKQERDRVGYRLVEPEKPHWKFRTRKGPSR